MQKYFSLSLNENHSMAVEGINGLGTELLFNGSYLLDSCRHELDLGIS